MRGRTGHVGIAALLAAAALALAGCTVTVSGHASLAAVPKATLPVVGDSGGDFDQLVKNALTDILTFWRKVYPSVSGGQPLPELRGKLYSVAPPNFDTAVKAEACIRNQGPATITNNAEYCPADDSILWDRNPQHIVPILPAEYGPLVVALVFAHEFGHAVQARLEQYRHPRTPADKVHKETQADCASGAFAATVTQGRASHVRATPADFERAQLGYLAVRDQRPLDERGISHGDGFDRLAAFSTGFSSGVTACYAASWDDRFITERAYAPGEPEQSNGGNTPLDDVIAEDGALRQDLNDAWQSGFQTPRQTVDGREARSGRPSGLR